MVVVSGHRRSGATLNHYVRYTVDPEYACQAANYLQENLEMPGDPNTMTVAKSRDTVTPRRHKPSISDQSEEYVGLN